jgi:hypothetical protein
MIKIIKEPTAGSWPEVVMEAITDPEELDRGRARRAQYDRNFAWLKKHGPEIYPLHRGKFIAISGEKLFVADTAEEADAIAAAAHPEDEGRFVHYVPREKRLRI